MPGVKPIAREQLEEFEPVFKLVEAAMGFVPNSMFTMAHKPELLRAFGALGTSVLGSGTLPPDLKQLVAFVASRASGCQYCQAHTGSSAVRSGASVEKLQAAFEFETSELFNEAERAALRLANDAALVPNATTDAHFEALKRHYDDAQIVELVGVVSLFGYLNRWNDTMGTTLEREPLEFAKQNLAPGGWSPGKHT